MAVETKPKSVKAGQIKGVKVNPLTADEEKVIEDALPAIYDIDTAAEFIKPLENQDTKGAAKLEAHKDVNGQTIVGWGTRADDLKPGDVITEQDAQDRLNVKIKDIVEAIKRNGGADMWKVMSPDEKASVISTLHNTGESKAIFSRKPGEKGQYTEFFKALLAGDKEKAGEENDFGNLPGHKKRRQAENKKAGREGPRMQRALPPTITSGSN
jgi:GH24 family phage-related lysozyme (muramidase)